MRTSRNHGIPLIIRARRCLLGAVFFSVELPLSAVGAAPAQIQPWVYDSMLELAAEGYLELPSRPLGNYSRQELSVMVGKALNAVEKNRTGTLADEYARITRLLVMDEVELKLAQEQEAVAVKRCGTAKAKAARAAEMYLRRSLQGQNRLEVMEPLKAKNDEAQAGLEYAARDYAEAQSRVKQRSRMLEYARKKQESLLTSLNGADGSSSGTELPDKSEQNAVLENAGRLRAEFLPELEANGSLDKISARQQLASNLPVKDVPDQAFKLDTELRVDSGRSSGDHGQGTRTRARVRLYPDYNIDNNWHIKGMVEWQKALSGPKYSKDGKVNFDRYYVSGNIGQVQTDIGAFGSLMAEGNIYDSKFEGVRLAAGKPVRYTLEAGKADYEGMKHTYDLAADYESAAYKVGAAYYHFAYDNDQKQYIYMGNYHHNLGIFDLGGMLLRGRESGNDGRTGYVFSLAYAPQNSWRPYTYNSWLKYYYQPRSTYVNHTMNGMAGAMSGRGGFKGWGWGCNYNLPDDWSLGLELYHLQDLDIGHSSNTIWGSVTKYFKNYRE